MPGAGIDEGDERCIREIWIKRERNLKTEEGKKIGLGEIIIKRGRRGDRRRWSICKERNK